MTVAVRPATADDIPALQEIGRRTWPPTYGFAGDDYVANGLATWWSAEALERSLAETTTLVAVRNDALIGVGNVDLRPPVPVIWKLYVLPDAQRTGAGSALLDALLAQLPPDASAVRLEYLDGNDKAARFYAAKGFAELRREPDERPDWPDAVWMERPVGPRPGGS